jgi:hypothetical protein
MPKRITHANDASVNVPNVKLIDGASDWLGKAKEMLAYAYQIVSGHGWRRHRAYLTALHIASTYISSPKTFLPSFGL